MYIIWKPIKGYPQYLINNKGQVMSNKSRKSILLKQSIGSHGYKVVTLYFQGSCKTLCVHRLVAEMFHDNNDNKPHVNHIDGDKLNNDFDNLEWSTVKENVNHGISLNGLNKGCFKKGDNRKLSDEQIQAIKKDNRSSRVIAKEYGVSKDTILYWRKK